ncbi:MAG: YdcF family protein [Propionicimonas sp.]|uniref:YdcF family protein n=1 Tax=Propionicimonas sp. TaxID=1955623 RepID=UPI003D1323FF
MQRVRRPARPAARVVLATAGLVLTANAVWLAFTANLTVGTAATALAGLGLLAWARWLPRRRWLNVVGVVLVAAVAGSAALLTSAGTHDTATGEEDAVIVLGAAVHGDELSRTLASRLDAALAYHQRNPGAVIVVTGGQGAQENLPEADAMQAYLLARGIPSEDILVEDRATSTVENFAFSKALLDARLPSGYRVVFVTDEFHVFRAGGLAAAAGLDATHVSSRTPWYFWPANYLREELAVAASWLGIG